VPILSIDWPEIKNKLAGDTCLFALTNRQSAILLSLSEQLTWSKTWRVDGYDFSDKDELDAEIADLQAQLAMPVNISTIISLIDEVEDLLRSIDAHSQCCGEVDPFFGDTYTDPVIDGEGSVPQDIIDAGYADDANDWDGFEDYKCMISHIMIDSMELSLRQFIPLFGSSGEILGGIGSVAAVLGVILTATGPIAVGIIGVLGAVGGFMTALLGLGEVATEALADSIAENHDELVCAIYQADGSSAAVDALKDKIDELYSDLNALLLKNMNIEASLKALYAGRYDQENIAQNLADSEFDTADYTCTCTAQPVDMDVYGLRWDWSCVYSGAESEVYVELPWDSQSINTGSPQTVDPVVTGSGIWWKIAFGKEGAIQVGDGDQLYVAPTNYWDEAKRWLWWRFRQTDAHARTVYGVATNFQALVSDGEGGYIWRDANMHAEQIGGYLSFADNTLTVSHSGTGYINSQLQLHIDSVMVPPF
jgi:hypothetical protein